MLNQMQSGTNDSAIMCTGLTKTFYTKDSAVYALRSVDLTVQRGEFLMIVGPSGCGKTTLISVIASILTPDAGDCIVDGYVYRDMDENQRLDFRAHHIGFIFQSFNLIPSLSLLENISIPLIVRGVAHDDAHERAYEMLCKMNLIKKIDRKPTQLSGGEQQRIAIARALVHRPSILICDEPTSALDHATGTSIMELMKEMNAQLQTTCVVVTHDPRIYRYADRIAHMNDGALTHISVPGVDDMNSLDMKDRGND